MVVVFIAPGGDAMRDGTTMAKLSISRIKFSLQLLGALQYATVHAALPSLRQRLEWHQKPRIPAKAAGFHG